MNKGKIWVTLALAAFLATACGMMRPRMLHHGWTWDGVFRVMPNSVFEPVAQAKEATLQPAEKASLPATSQHEELSLVGPWRYRPDPEAKGETEGWSGPGFDDSGWKKMPCPNNFSIDDPSLKDFYKPVWFRRVLNCLRALTGKSSGWCLKAWIISPRSGSTASF